jgi:hypothetical protein
MVDFNYHQIRQLILAAQPTLCFGVALIMIPDIQIMEDYSKLSLHYLA